MLLNATHALRTVYDVSPDQGEDENVQRTAAAVADLTANLCQAAAESVGSESLGEVHAEEGYIPKHPQYSPPNAENLGSNLHHRGYRRGFKPKKGVATDDMIGRVLNMTEIRKGVKEQCPDEDTFARDSLLSAVTGAFSLAPAGRKKALLALARDVIDLAEAMPDSDVPEETEEAETETPADEIMPEEAEESAQAVDPTKETAD